MPDKTYPRTLISYRRDDAGGWARFLFDNLRENSGFDHVFIDFDGIRSGENFEKKIVAEIEQSKVVLGVIGNHWLNAKDEKGNRRLDDEEDPVRVEIRE